MRASSSSPRSLFGRHVHCRPENISRQRQRIFDGDSIVRGKAWGKFGQSEVEYLHLPGVGNEDIGGLDVAMNDAFFVAGGQCVRHLDADIQNLVDVHGLATQTLFQADALELLHDDERQAVHLFNVVDGADAGVVQLRGSAGLPQEAVHRLLVVDQVVRNELQSDVAAQTRVFRVIDKPHATTAEFPHNVIVGDCLADHPRTSVPLAVMLGPAADGVNSTLPRTRLIRD